MTSITHHVPGTGARPAAALVGTSPGSLARLRDAVWEALSAVGRSRGRAALLALARDHEATRPELAAQLRSAARRGWL